MNGRSVLDRFLRTDSLDAGCDGTFELLDLYVEERLAGRSPEVRFPGVAAHLRICDPCLDDYEGVLAAAGA
jgi:hypothetical protein